jgi:DNA repair protein RecO (recombination protein O)
MYRKFTTEGLVLGKRAIGEANAMSIILTKDFGLLRAIARSARRERSKLRYGLEPLTQGQFSLVEGKREWRLAGVEQVDRSLLASTPARRQALGRITRLLLRLIQGEEANRALYKDVVEGFFSLSAAQSEQDAASIECIVVLRILSRLGYLSQTAEVSHFLEGDFFSLGLAAQAASARSRLIRLINDSLSASGL